MLGGSWVVISGAISEVANKHNPYEGTYNHTFNYP